MTAVQSLLDRLQTRTDLTIESHILRVIRTQGLGYRNIAEVLKLSNAVNDRRGSSNLPPISIQSMSEQIRFYSNSDSLSSYINTLLEDTMD